MSDPHSQHIHRNYICQGECGRYPYQAILRHCKEEESVFSSICRQIGLINSVEAERQFLAGLLRDFKQDPHLDEAFQEEDAPQQNDSTFRVEFLLYLWYHLLSKADTGFRKALDYAEQSGFMVPPCALSALLLEAIRCQFDGGVAVLLEKGASPHRSLRRKSNEAIQPASFRIQRDKLTISPIAACIDEINRNHVAHSYFGSGCALSRSLRLLFESCINNHFNRNLFDGNNYVIVELVPELALKCPQSVDVLLETFSRTSPCLLQEALANWHMKTSFVIFRSTVKTPRLIAFGLLPLLKAGARLDHCSNCLDVFQGPPGTNSLEGEVLCSQLWGSRQNWIPGEILDESRQTYWTSRDGSRPRQLQLICRQVVLRCLPFGIRAREDAIDRLDFPTVLEDFLKFRELNTLRSCEI